MEQLNGLWYKMKDVVWVVKVESERRFRNKPSVVETIIATGFSVHEDGLILTSDYRLFGGSNISVRGFHDTQFISAKKVGVSNDSGMALLKIEKKIDDIAQLAGGDVGLTRGFNVYGMAHHVDFYYSFLFGELLSSKGKAELNIEHPTLARHIGTLDDNLQFLEIKGFQCDSKYQWMMQTLGGPVFNVNGIVVGMIIATCSGFDYVVPIECVKNLLAGVSRNQLSGEGSSRQHA